MKRVNFRTAYVWIIFSFWPVLAAYSNNLQDGLYIPDVEQTSPLVVVIKDRKGVEHKFRVKEYNSIMVRNVVIYSLKPHENAFQVQIDLDSSDKDWSQKPLLLLVNQKPYLELTKSEALSSGKKVFPASATLKVSDEAEANIIKNRLKKRFGIK
jgi:hypothetical protein